MEIFNKRYRNRNKVPQVTKRTRPIAGRVLLTYAKDRYTLATLCSALEVDFKTDVLGHPLKSTTDGIIEALIHQIMARDVSIGSLINALQKEMVHSRHPFTTKEEWDKFKLFEATDNFS